jgi:hypothetical protein
MDPGVDVSRNDVGRPVGKVVINGRGVGGDILRNVVGEKSVYRNFIRGHIINSKGIVS